MFVDDSPGILGQHILTGIRTVGLLDEPTDYTDDQALQGSVDTMLAETGFAAAHLTVVLITLIRL